MKKEYIVPVIKVEIITISNDIANDVSGATFGGFQGNLNDGQGDWIW